MITYSPVHQGSVIVNIYHDTQHVGTFSQATRELRKHVKRGNILRIDNSIGFNKEIMETLQPSKITIQIDDGRVLCISGDEYTRRKKTRQFCGFEPQEFVQLKYFTTKE